MRVALAARGVVQGVGFRPWVCILARKLGLSGWVRNTSGAAELEAQGAQASLRSLVDRLRQGEPPIRVDELHQREVPEVLEEEGQGFRIVESRVVEGGGALGALPLSADLATCLDCAQEVLNPASRRFGHAFTTCTRCGPRYSVVDSLPFDRTRSSLKSFPLCAVCSQEYGDPSNRRYHAQTLACPACGPALRFQGEEVAASFKAGSPLQRAVALLLGGKTVAVLGLGGFQLMADATNESAVARLRQRKGRPTKPLAVLFADLSAIRQHCCVTLPEQRLLASPEAPIVLVDRLAIMQERGQALSRSVAPGGSRVGALLPTTPLHLLLVQAVGRPMVCTSGNSSGEPMIVDAQQAQSRLSGVADALLTHDRGVVRAVDDSVVQMVGGRAQSLRRARGYVPGRAIPLPPRGSTSRNGRVVLALGAHQKSTVTLAFSHSAFVSPHLGDLNSVESRRNYEAQVLSWCKLYRVRPTELACDLHTGHTSSLLARKLAAKWAVPLRVYQHHHAHIAACMAEHCLSGRVLGLAWDGAGQGSDGTLWGGEVLQCEGVRCERVGQLSPFRLPGGEKAMLEPKRAALGLLHGAGLLSRAVELGWYKDRELSVLGRAMDRGVNAPWTSSVGRLFDAAVALSGLHCVCDHEGQAAAAWMELAEQSSEAAGAYELQVDDQGVLDWRPLLDGLLLDRDMSVALPTRARRFHQSLANAAAILMERAGLSQVALGGGCFQNRLLVSLIEQRARALRVTLSVPRSIPPNDAGISLGQAWLAWQADGE